MSGVVFKVTADTNQADRRLDEINKSVKQINVSASALSSTFSNAFRNIAATIGLVNIASTLKSASDAAINLENRIKTVATLHMT